MHQAQNIERIFHKSTYNLGVYHGGKSPGRVKNAPAAWVKSMGKGDRQVLRGMKSTLKHY